MVEILRISSFLMVFFYRRFLPRDVIYAFGAENGASSSGSAYPFVQTGWAVMFGKTEKDRK